MTTMATSNIAGILCIVVLVALAMVPSGHGKVAIEPSAFTYRQGLILVEKPKSIMNNSNSASNTSTRSWHVADVWTMVVVAIGPFSASHDLLGHLANDSGKQDVPYEHTFEPQTLDRKSRRHKKTHKLRKLLIMGFSDVSWYNILLIPECVALTILIRFARF